MWTWERQLQLASRLAGVEVSEADDDLVREAVCELANQIIGNSITTLNDQGFHFHVRPPTLHTSEQGSKSSEDTEALVMCFNTSSGNVFMNVALRYNRRRAVERAVVAG
jgi:CheY-specific phosphatase CheX